MVLSICFCLFVCLSVCSFVCCRSLLVAATSVATTAATKGVPYVSSPVKNSLLVNVVLAAGSYSCMGVHKRPTLWDIKNVAVNFLQQLLQILTDFDNFYIKLTRNE